MTVTIDGSASVTINSGAVLGINSGTAVASTSGTSIDFTSIPSYVKRITVMFSGVSTSGTSHILVQLGAGSVTSTGYISTGQYNITTVGNVSSTAGFIVWNDLASYTFSGSMKIQTLGSNIWVSDHTFKVATNQTGFGGGDITLGGTLDRLRITTVSGTPTFDAGTINILYE